MEEKVIPIHVFNVFLEEEFTESISLSPFDGIRRAVESVMLHLGLTEDECAVGVDGGKICKDIHRIDVQKKAGVPAGNFKGRRPVKSLSESDPQKSLIVFKKNPFEPKEEEVNVKIPIQVYQRDGTFRGTCFVWSRPYDGRRLLAKDVLQRLRLRHESPAPEIEIEGGGICKDITGVTVRYVTDASEFAFERSPDPTEPYPNAQDVPSSSAPFIPQRSRAAPTASEGKQTFTTIRVRFLSSPDSVAREDTMTFGEFDGRRKMAQDIRARYGLREGSCDIGFEGGKLACDVREILVSVRSIQPQ
eukprot:TRINITY_DN82201_c0_g1_i1.p1 TRINITY_DN82201_c0_g1~~TRINITY_DN82201_c0_g1_i1.p1  ORF type:complete len:303 (-),score=72.71 TRINITY_DN82201_c0_g1_i1:3-911(-)